MIRALALPVVMMAALVGKAGAAPSFIERLRTSVHARIDAAIIAKPPVLVPPVPVARAWKVTKIGTLDLGAPLAALAAGDADGNGAAELYAVTPRELVAITIIDKKPRIAGRVAFTGDRRRVPPRDIVASVVVDGAQIAAAASPWERSVRARWQERALVAAPADPGFPQCRGEPLAPLAGNRNYLGEVATGFYATRCTESLVDREGYRLTARAQLTTTNRLDVDLQRCAAVGLGCQPAGHHEHTAIGTAFEIADLDRDGAPELVHAGPGAPGDPDALRIVALGASDKAAPKLRKAFTAGGVAGIAVADVDGDGVTDLIVAVRVVGAPRVDLWRLE